MTLHRIILPISLFFTLQSGVLANDSSELREELNFILSSGQDLSYYQVIADAAKAKKMVPPPPNPLGLDRVSTALSATDKDFEVLDVDDDDDSDENPKKEEEKKKKKLEIIPIIFEDFE